MWKIVLRRLRDVLGAQAALRPTFRRCRLNLERLEEREVPAVITVTSLADGNPALDGVVTLREAIISVDQDADVNADVTLHRNGAYGASNSIVFAAALGSGTISLSQ